jgi:hypothetical protein
MKLDTLLSLLAAGLIALALGVGGWTLSGDSKRLLSEAERRQISITAEVMGTAVDQAAMLSLTHAEALAGDPTVKRLMAARDRPGLLAYTRPLYERLAATAGVDVMHFHDPELRSFLRVTDPDNFGQDLSRVRPMIIAVNRHRKTAKGLEFGVTGLSLRAAAPIEQNGTLVGTVEAGIDLGGLAELAKAATGSDFAIFLDAAATAGKTEGGALKIEAATDTAFFETLRASGSIRLSRTDYFTQADLDGRTYGIMGRPLLDYSGDMIGMVITTSDVTSLHGHVSRSLVTLVAVLLSGFLVTFAAFMIALRAFVLRPLETLAAWCSDAGGADGTLPPAGAIGEFRTLRDAAVSLKARARGSEPT